MLKVLSEYKNKNLHYLPGSTLNLDSDEEAFLLRDAPGCFEVITESAPAKDPGSMSASQAISYGRTLSPAELAEFLRQERDGKARKGVLKVFASPADKMQRAGVRK